MSTNPSNLAALPAKQMENRGSFAAILQPVNRYELTNDGPIATAATTTTPFGFATGDQADDLVTTVNQIRAGLIALGLFTDTTANVD